MSRNNTSYDDDDIVTLLSASGEEIDFIEVAGIAYRGKFYAILQPVELLEGMDDDEALVFEVTKDAKGDDKFNIELDDDIIDAVFKEYNRLLDEAQENNNASSSNSSSRGSVKKSRNKKPLNIGDVAKKTSHGIMVIIKIIIAVAGFGLALFGIIGIFATDSEEIGLKIFCVVVAIVGLIIGGAMVRSIRRNRLKK